MNNFTFQNPVKLIFGKGSIAKLAKEIPADEDHGYFRRRLRQERKTACTTRWSQRSKAATS